MKTTIKSNKGNEGTKRLTLSDEVIKKARKGFTYKVNECTETENEIIVTSIL